MTARNASSSYAGSVQTIRPINLLERMKFQNIRPIQRSEIPLGRGRSKGAGMAQLQVVREFNALLDQINKDGLNPCEIAGEIDVKGPEIEAEKKKRKSFSQSFRKLLRQSVKEHGLSKQIDVMEFDHGARFFVVGRS